MKKLLTVLLSVFALQCSSFESHFRLQGVAKKPSTILIGYFERRSLKYNPYIEKNFRDTLRFDFFSLGYKSELVVMDDEDTFQVIKPERKKSPEENSAFDSDSYNTIVKKQSGSFSIHDMTKEKVAEACKKYSADIYLHGAISEIETGNFIDSKSSTFINVIIFNNRGEIIGEAQYRAPSGIADDKVMQSIALQFVNKVHGKLPRY